MLVPAGFVLTFFCLAEYRHFSRSGQDKRTVPLSSKKGALTDGQLGRLYRANIAAIEADEAHSAPAEGTASFDADMVAQDVVDRYVDHSISKSKFVENPLITDESVADLSLGKVSDALTSKIWNEYGVDIHGKTHVLTDNDIRHMYNRHGPHTPEALPVTAADIKMIPTIISHPDDVYYLPRKDRKVGLMYRYRHNGTTFFLEQIIGDTLKSKQMIKVPTGTIPDVEGLADAIKAKSTSSLPGDAAGAVPQMYVQDVRSDAFLNSSIPQPPTGVNLQRSLPGDIPADIPPGLRKLYRLAQEMSTKPQPREIPQRPVQQSPQEILARLAQGMTQAPGSPLADRSDGDLADLLGKIVPGQGSDVSEGLDDLAIETGETKQLKNTAGQLIIEVEHIQSVAAPNSITQRTGRKGGIDRNFYGEDGVQKLQISNYSHGHKEEGALGIHGEHAHDYYVDEDGNLIRGKARELTDEERRDNDDFL